MQCHFPSWLQLRLPGHNAAPCAVFPASTVLLRQIRRGLSSCGCGFGARSPSACFHRLCSCLRRSRLTHRSSGNPKGCALRFPLSFTLGPTNTMKQLERLLFVQGGDCFFCKKPLPKAEASVEHLVASANGGSNAEENCVACCKSLNSLLGSKPLKDKLEVFLRQKGDFKCPAATSKPALPAKVAPKTATAPVKAITSVKAPTKPPSKPLFTLAPLPNVRSAPPPKPTTGRMVMCPTCKNGVPAAVGQVDYVCESCGGAFRY